MTCAKSHREKLLAFFHSDRPHPKFAFQMLLVSLSLSLCNGRQSRILFFCRHRRSYTFTQFLSEHRGTQIKISGTLIRLKPIEMHVTHGTVNARHIHVTRSFIGSGTQKLRKPVRVFFCSGEVKHWFVRSIVCRIFPGWCWLVFDMCKWRKAIYDKSRCNWTNANYDWDVQ